jgi:kynurenine formamidase
MASKDNDLLAEIRALLAAGRKIEAVKRYQEAGAIAVVTFPKPKGGSGFPARVFAIVP